MKYLLTILSVMLLMTSCKSDDDTPPVNERAKRTVLGKLSLKLHFKRRQ